MCFGWQVVIKQALFPVLFPLPNLYNLTSPLTRPRATVNEEVLFPINFSIQVGLHGHYFIKMFSISSHKILDQILERENSEKSQVPSWCS